jgi:hypothetical protein
MSEATPTVRHLIVCEDVQTDPDNALRVTLVGLLSAIRSVEQPAYPLLYRELCAFVQLTECRGPAAVRVQIEQSDTNQEVFRTQTRTVPFGNDPLELYAVSFRIRNCLFPSAGLYWVQFWYNDELIDEQALVMR